MDSTLFATDETSGIPRAIPTEIYDSLWNVAIRGYQPQHVDMWYQAILQDLRQMVSSNANGPGVQAEPMSAQDVDFLDSGCAARRATVATIDSGIGPPVNFNAVSSTEIPFMDGSMAQTPTVYGSSSHDTASQPYHTPQSYATYTTTPRQLDTTPEPSKSQHLMTHWSPAPASVADSDLYTMPAPAPLSNGNLMALAQEPPPGVSTYPWLPTPGGNNSLHTRTHSQQSHMSQHSLHSNQDQSQVGQPPPPQQMQHQQAYITTECNPQNMIAPVLVPYASSVSSGSYRKAAAISGGPGASFYSSSAGYFPIIHVSSSRKRRKAMQKGVNKLVQPLKERRQQSV